MHGIHSHKVTDHQYYWEDGAQFIISGTTLISCGQENKWIGDVESRDPLAQTAGRSISGYRFRSKI